MTTIDAHGDKIWALAVPQDKSNQVDTFVTGSADGDIKVWRNNTAEQEEEELQKREELFLKEQEFQKALQRNDYKEALRLARLYGCTAAVLKEKSPSCGCGRVYDGTFSGTLTDGDGVTAALLKENGIKVYGESELEKLL